MKKQVSFWSPENIKQMIILILVILAFRWSVASPYHVPTASMEPTIKVGDRLLAWKLAYNLKIPFTDYVLFEWGKPEVGDIIVFKYPRDPNIDYVKRVVGVEGDRVKFSNYTLYINDAAQPRTNHQFDRSILEDIHDDKSRKVLYKENLNGKDHWIMSNVQSSTGFLNPDWPVDSPDHKVSKDSLIVIGDNRDNSTDSRFWGEVPLSYVRGKAMFVIWSVYSSDTGFLPKIRYSRFGHSLN